MKLFGIQIGETDKKNIKFGNTRVCRNTVAQLAKNNPYSLSEPNQRNIANAIAALAKIPGEKNIKFLLNTAAKATYTTNITLQDKPKNDWKRLLLGAVASAIAITPFVNQSAFDKKIDRLNKNKIINGTEKDILDLRKRLLSAVNLEQIKNESKDTAKDFEKNLDYFIISSETTLEHKKYVLERLNYLMSDEYDINYQLADKKSLVAAEMVNDMAIAVPGNKIPNIKAVNQKKHGICAEISIVRKKLAYEDKPNYVDSILSELDNSGQMEVYDRSKLGSGKKISVAKPKIDYDAALAQGYRIIDASSAVWMGISKFSGYSNISYVTYNPFDAENFDVKNDSFFNMNFQDEELAKMQGYYQALIKLKSSVDSYKSLKIKKNVLRTETYGNSKQLQYEMSQVSDKLREFLSSAFQELNKDQVNKLLTGILGLERPSSKKSDKNNPYQYIPNEEEIVKKSKVSDYIRSQISKEISDQNLNRIYEFIAHYHSLEYSLNPSQFKIKSIGKLNSLYKIAAAFRHAFTQGLENKKYMEMLAKNEGFTNKEDLLLETIDTLIRKLESDSSNSDIIIRSLSSLIDKGKPVNKENLITALKDIRASVENIINSTLDSTYEFMLKGDKKLALAGDISSLLIEITENKNTVLKNQIASALNISNYDKIVAGTLQKYLKMLENGGEKEYSYVYNKLKGFSQFESLRHDVQNFLDLLDSENKEAILEAYNEGLEGLEKFDEVKLKESLIQHISNLNEAENIINSYIDALKVVDGSGHVVYSANVKDLLVRKYENNGELLSIKDLKLLQTHLDNIEKEWASNEFSTRHGKLRNRELRKLSDKEKKLLAGIDKNVNSINSYAQRFIAELRYIYKTPLEELYRMAGVDEGQWWLSEGKSGLGTGNQIKILEFITGRPHYATKELNKAIDEIKQSPYSGISSSSVYDDRLGFHAQYIADIEPVDIKDQNGVQKREILFHDNTWGAIEHDNIWIDSSGLTRTDYGDGRGGSLGYVTNKMYRNGNLVNRILGDMILEEKSENVNNKIYKKIIKPHDEAYKSSQYDEIILDGTSPELEETADNIRENIFQSSVGSVGKLKKIVQELTIAELKAKISDVNYAGGRWEDEYERLIGRIFDRLGEKFETKEEYDALPDNDKLKVTLEKVALKSNYNSVLYVNQIAKINNVKDLAPFAKKQKTDAVKKFSYSFDKSINCIEYFVNNIDEKKEKAINNILSKYNITVDEDKFAEIFKTFDIDTSEFNGSLKHTIDLILESFSENLIGLTNNNNAINDLMNLMTTFLRESLYFNKSDLGNKKLSKIIKFIDREFKPEDDEEFVKTYRAIQDMTKDEFKKNVLSKVTPDDLGIKKNTGYDVLKKIKKI